MSLFFWNQHLNFKQLNLVLDGELDDAHKLCLDKHLAKCNFCARKLAELRAVSQSIEQMASQLETSESAASVWPKIEESISRKNRVHLSWRERFGVSFPVFVARPAIAFSIVAMILVFTFFVFERKTMAENEAQINSITSDNKIVMIFKTKERKITVIWLAEPPAGAIQPKAVSS